MVRSCHPLIVTWVQLADIQLSSRRPWLQLSSPGMRCEAKAWLRGWLLSSCSTARWGGLTFDHRNYIIYIWVNCNSSLTWIVGPFWDDFPQSNHDSRVRENSEVISPETSGSRVVCLSPTSGPSLGPFGKPWETGKDISKNPLKNQKKVEHTGKNCWKHH